MRPFVAGQARKAQSGCSSLAAERRERANPRCARFCSTLQNSLRTATFRRDAFFGKRSHSSPGLVGSVVGGGVCAVGRAKSLGGEST
jgi:hypothetical protein